MLVLGTYDGDLQNSAWRLCLPSRLIRSASFLSFSLSSRQFSDSFELDRFAFVASLA